MSERVFLKLGGSLLTDKTRPEAPRLAVIRRVAREIAEARAARPDLQILLGHGSGSFGHVAGARYRVRQGYLTDWFGYAATGAAAQRLNRLVADALLEAGVPAVSLQASASARCSDGVLQTLAVEPARTLLERGAVPLWYGDVALDDVRGCTIVSTEELFAYLARDLAPARVIVAGEVDGVFSADPHRDPAARRIGEIHVGAGEALEGVLYTSHGVDVTGGMAAKVRILRELVRAQPGTSVRLLSGVSEGRIREALLDPDLDAGTLIHD